ncbi:YihY/virulence factor BrkB family protein [Pseudokineococcus sp. 1T1Z-3]|uniref:YihY/virulence factor BrkB family protein n=1 Tax=Pseudokineococcus sp. 1T1Z-3 TaxID=3132745 RepID=UPI003098BC51
MARSSTRGSDAGSSSRASSGGGQPASSHEAAYARTTAKDDDAPDARDDRKPDDPGDLTKPTAGYILKRTVREFGRDEVTELAAGLVFRTVLALFPAIIALVSLLGIVGQSDAVITAIEEVTSQVGTPEQASGLVDTVEGFVENQSSAGLGLGLVIGLLGALWTASGYVMAFSKAVNKVYDVAEGRPTWKLRPLMLAWTLVLLVLLALGVVIIGVTGPVAQAVGDVIGLGGVAVTVWSIAKWPVLLVVVVVTVALLYTATPNLQQPKFRWVSPGAVVAIVVWFLGSAAFGVYLAFAGSYDETYGALAGVIIALLWLWITNIALLFGAELDAELERGRELQAGIRAEESIQLPPRDTTLSEKRLAQVQEDIDAGYRLRLRNGGESRADQAEREAAEAAASGRAGRS